MLLFEFKFLPCETGNHYIPMNDSDLSLMHVLMAGDHGLPAGFGPHDLQCFGSKMSKEDSTVYNLKV